jgi:hypothetical protein
MTNYDFINVTLACTPSTIQSNSVITNSTEPSIFVRYSRDIVISMKLYVVKEPFGTK